MSARAGPAHRADTGSSRRRPDEQSRQPALNSQCQIGRPEMESYEEFCTHSLARLQAEGPLSSVTTGQRGALSIIQFHGMAVLSPLLSAEQRQEMTQYRQRAVELEAGRLSVRRSTLLSRVQDILDSVQMRTVPKEGETAMAPSRCSPKSEVMNGFALLPDMNALGPWGGSVPLRAAPSEPLPQPDRERGELEEEDPSYTMSLQSLLKKSREYLEREHSRRGSRGHKGAPALGESLSDKENESGGGSVGAGGEQPHCEDHQHSDSPLAWPTTPAPVQQPSSDSDSPDSLSVLPRSLTGSYARLPSPEPSLSPRVHRRRPRPLSAGNIVITRPLSACELSPRPDRQPLHEDSAVPTLQAVPGEPGPWEPRVEPCPAELRVPSTPHKRQSSPLGQEETLGRETPEFRKRSQTLDSQLSPAGPRGSQERIPGFLGSLPRRVPRRRCSPAPLNQSYDVESPSPALLRPCVDGASPEGGSAKKKLEASQGSREGRLTPSLPATPGEEPRGWDQTPGSSVGEGPVKRQVVALEEMRRRLQEEHALQLSLLIAEQEREQLRLRQELQEQERRLRDQGPELSQAADAGPDWRGISESCPAGPTVAQGERSPTHMSHSLGFPPQPVASSQSPFYLRGPSWMGNKPRSRVSQAIPPELHQRFCRLSAVAKGFLTRRLLLTEKVKHLRQTVQDTQEFIKTFQSEAPLKRGAVSPQDMSLQERVLAQLRAALFDLHDVFFEMPLSERLALLQQDRQLRTERRLREMEKARSPRERVTLSAATQKSLDRKKQRAADTGGHNRKATQKPKSPTTNRILQPNQGQNAPPPGQLHRQGSLYQKNLEERVKRCDSLRKQHSLG
ncbi:centriolar coiled-coil protein of 110 kDa isoform X2 [Amia ocellicauda]|uniref:centriolar coiled-coil protein of 110 kDa isoform X2 n=1 Tax=Amia ocellicauda TaxID=2972642 RepID=UPI0034645AD3